MNLYNKGLMKNTVRTAYKKLAFSKQADQFLIKTYFNKQAEKFLIPPVKKPKKYQCN